MALVPVVPNGPRRPEQLSKVQVVPEVPVKPAWDERKDSATSEGSDAATEGEEYSWPLWFETVFLFCLAVLDNVFCYVVYFNVRGFGLEVYNIVDVQLALVPWLAPGFLAAICIGTIAFISIFVFVECFQKPFFHEVMNIRMAFSGSPCAFACAVTVYYSGQSEWVALCAFALIMLTIFSWCVHMRLRYSHQFITLTKVSLDVSWFGALICGGTLAVLFCADRLDVITQSGNAACPYANNTAMPVRSLALDEWFCATWDRDLRTDLQRPPVNVVPDDLLCNDSFVSIYGVSIQAHTFTCPEGCLDQFTEGSLIGCGVYATDTSVCIAAIHSGALTDAGGSAVVYGRVGLPHFDRCQLSSLISDERYITDEGRVTVAFPSRDPSIYYSTVGSGTRRLTGGDVAAPTVYDGQGVQLVQAFHFNRLPWAEEFIWLKGWDTRSTKDEGVRFDQPWTKVEATVTARVAGIELQDELVQLGAPAGGSTVQHGTEGQNVQCRLISTGVLCHGTGASAMHLDFCQPDLARCP